MESEEPAVFTPVRRDEGRAGPGQVFTAVLALLTFAGCGGEETTARDTAPSPVEATVARMDTLSVTVEAVGSLEANARVEVKPEASGRVSEVLFREGDTVRAGQVLVRLDRNKLTAELEAARAAVSQARAEAENLARQLRRNDSLLARGAISQQAYDDLETRYNTARARLDQVEANLSLAREELEDATLRAPFDGRVGARSFDLGDYLSVGTPMFTIVDDDPLEIRFSVPERYLGQLERGRPVTVRVRSAPERSFRGEVDFISPYVDAANRTVELRALIPNPLAELRPGQFASVELELEERPAVLVPEAAVLSRQEGSTVFLVRAGTATPRSVQLGLRREGVVEVLSGVSAGDTVVVAGQQRLREGTEVALQMRGLDLTRSQVGPEAGSDDAGARTDTAGAASDTAGAGAGLAPAEDDRDEAPSPDSAAGADPGDATSTAGPDDPSPGT